MLIGRTSPRILLPVPQAVWREPSLAQPKDVFGRQNRTRFVLELWQRDGGLVDRQWFDDRDAFDYALWRARFEDPHPDLVPLYAAVTTITASAGSVQNYLVPHDWNSLDNMVECIGGGGSGGVARFSGSNRSAAGAAGGGYGRYANLALNGNAVIQYRVGAHGAAVSISSNTTQSGNPGTDSWFNGASYAAASVGGLGGPAGQGSGSAVATPGGGVSGKGTLTRTSGSGGTTSTGSNQSRASGGGGAAGRNGNGNSAPAVTGGNSGAGASADGGAGGAAGAANGGNGGDGINMNGVGGGGGGGGDITSSPTGGNGGNYGGGGGGAADDAGTITSGAGRQGAILITYTPLTTADMFEMF